MCPSLLETYPSVLKPLVLTALHPLTFSFQTLALASPLCKVSTTCHLHLAVGAEDHVCLLILRGPFWASTSPPARRQLGNLSVALHSVHLWPALAASIPSAQLSVLHGEFLHPSTNRTRSCLGTLW